MTSSRPAGLGCPAPATLPLTTRELDHLGRAYRAALLSRPSHGRRMHPSHNTHMRHIVRLTTVREEDSEAIVMGRYDEPWRIISPDNACTCQKVGQLGIYSASRASRRSTYLRR